MQPTSTNEVTEYAARAGPGVAAAGLHFMGISIGDWVQIVVLVYTVAQLGLFIYTRIQNHRKLKANGG